MSSAPLTFAPPPLAAERRRTRRIEVLLPVEVEIGGERRVARITEISRAGAGISLRGPKAIGEPLTIRRNGVELKGRIVWADEGRAGLWFPQALDERSFLELRKRTVG